MTENTVSIFWADRNKTNLNSEPAWLTCWKHEIIKNPFIQKIIIWKKAEHNHIVGTWNDWWASSKIFLNIPDPEINSPREPKTDLKHHF